MSLDFGALGSERAMEAMLAYDDGSLSVAPAKDIRVEDVVVERKNAVPLKKNTKEQTPLLNDFLQDLCNA